MEQEIPVLLCCCLLALGVSGAERAVSDEAVARDWMRQDADLIDVSACFANPSNGVLEAKMLRRGKDEPGASPRRVFTRSYVTLTADGNPTALANWPLQESVPTLHKPYTSGSGASGLMECLELTHCGRELSADEKETVALWLDLAVPFCGSYLEGRLWTKEEELRYAHYQDKRLLYAREELEMARRRKGKDR